MARADHSSDPSSTSSKNADRSPTKIYLVDGEIALLAAFMIRDALSLSTVGRRPHYPSARRGRLLPLPRRSLIGVNAAAGRTE